MLRWCMDMEQFYLTVVHRTDDPELLAFLQTIRKEQPSREFLRGFWNVGRCLPLDMSKAVKVSQELQRRRGRHFMWLCVTNKGANEINDMALQNLDVTQAQRQTGYNGDANARAGKMFIKVGLWIRLTRNLDKRRGFVNGALGQVVDLLSQDAVGVNAFTVRLATGSMVLVHPIRMHKQIFLPCCYGYASTVRRAQGSSLHLGALYFDHCYPPERGYGYVGASRFRSSAGIFLYGKVRRSDWIPVGKAKPDWEMRRSAASVSSSSAHDSGYESDGDDIYVETASEDSSVPAGPESDDYETESDMEAAVGDDDYLDHVVEGSDGEHAYVDDDDSDLELDFVFGS